MKILTIHNRYKYRGGEDESRESEDALLAEKGHEIRQIVFDNATINARNAFRVGLQATWSHAAYARVRDYISVWRPDLLDVHNFFPLASPSIYYAARRAGIPVVQTLHNYRLLCPGATFYRNGAICEDCTRHSFPWPAVLHACYRRSSLQTGAVAIMISAHRLMRTWSRQVSLFFATCEYERQKFVENGVPASRIIVKPHFIVDPGFQGNGGSGFLFVGRLSPEKGIATMLKAFAQTQSASARLRILGDGPLEPLVREAALKDHRIEFSGRVSIPEVLQAMGSASAVLVTSEWHETFGRVAAEALAVGTPVIGTKLGGVGESVDEGKTGLCFPAGDSVALARILDRVSADPGILAAMRAAARAAYEARYTPERGYELIMKGYEQALANP